MGALLVAAAPVASAFHAESVHQTACVGCHSRITGGDGRVLYHRPDGRAHDYAQLLGRVDHCRRGAGLAAPPFSVEHMADFLNRRFYDFARPEAAP